MRVCGDGMAGSLASIRSLINTAVYQRGILHFAIPWKGPHRMPYQAGSPPPLEATAWGHTHTFIPPRSPLGTHADVPLGTHTDSVMTLGTQAEHVLAPLSGCKLWRLGTHTLRMLAFNLMAIVASSGLAQESLQPVSVSTTHAGLTSAPVAMATKLTIDSWPEMNSSQKSSPSSQTIVSLPVIDGRLVACKAAEGDLAARALRLRAQTLEQLYQQQKEKSQLAVRAVTRALELAAVQQQDLAAANGLRTYYTWIATTEQAALLANSRAHLAGQRASQLALLQEGIATGVDLSSFERQELELEDRQLQLTSQQRQLCSLLSQLTASDWEHATFAHESLDVRPQVLDSHRLQSTALQCRSDIQAWRSLQQWLTTETAADILKFMMTMPGGWSIPLPEYGVLGNLLCPLDRTCLTKNLAAELRTAESALAEAVCLSVSQRTERLRVGYERMQLAQRIVESWEGRVEQFTALEAVGDVRPEEKARALSSLLMARGDEIQRRLEARLAEVDLAEAVGGLAHRCCRGEAWLSSLIEQR